MKRSTAILASTLLLALAGAARGATPCDAGLALADVDPLSGAAAIELCDASSGGSPGVVSATYGSADLATPLDQLANGALGIGLLSAFGPNVLPQRGDRMLALSSGTARAPSDPDFVAPSGFDKGYTSAYPVGLPSEVPSCPGVIFGQPHDSVALRLVLQVPSWAHSFSFAFKFHSYDYPTFVCSTYNDWFFAALTPAPMTGPSLIFDLAGNPLTVNSVETIAVCTPQIAGGVSYPCASGSAELMGTGFEDHAATPWLWTSAPVAPDTTITVDLGIFDSGDGTLDSTVLLDDFRWSSRTIESPVTTVPEPAACASALAALAALSRARGPRRARRPSA